MNHFSRAFLATIIVLASIASHAKVDPPNYDFSLDQLKVFMPGSKLDAAKQKHGEAQLVKKVGAFEIHRLYVKHVRYKFPVLAQVNKGEITDFYARLPAYFLHDIFHQSIINRLGSQDVYKKVEEQAVYVWKNKDGLNHVYSGACTITCFPVYYSVYPDMPKFGGHVPILKLMTQQELFKTAP